jgi:hypothetical protein
MSCEVINYEKGRKRKVLNTNKELDKKKRKNEMENNEPSQSQTTNDDKPFLTKMNLTASLFFSKNQPPKQKNLLEVYTDDDRDESEDVGQKPAKDCFPINKWKKENRFFSIL